MGAIQDVADFVTTSSNWWGERGIVHRSVEHMRVSGAAVLAAGAIAVPAALYLGHVKRGGVAAQAIVNMFQRWYRHLGFLGCSSHSGRRTFITNAARKISTVRGSLRDVQILPGHTNLRTTQRYIEASPEAQRVVQQI